MSREAMDMRKLSQNAEGQGVNPRGVRGLLSLPVDNPLELDSVTQALGLPAFLVNLHLATKVKVFGKDAVHIPVQISPSERGRPSLYYKRSSQPWLDTSSSPRAWRYDSVQLPGNRGWQGQDGRPLRGQASQNGRHACGALDRAVACHRSDKGVWRTRPRPGAGGKLATRRRGMDSLEFHLHKGLIR